MSATETALDLGQLAILIEGYSSPDGPLEVDVVAIADAVIDDAASGWTIEADGSSVVVARLGEPDPTDLGQLVGHISTGIGVTPAESVSDELPAPAGTTAIRATFANGTGILVYVGAGNTPAPAAAPEANAGLPDTGLINLGMLRDVPLEVSAELGRTRMPVAEILQLNVGSVVELDRTAGSPVDVVVNGSLIARGEVVVIDDEYGVRITEIVGRVVDTL